MYICVIALMCYSILIAFCLRFFLKRFLIGIKKVFLSFCFYFWDVLFLGVVIVGTVDGERIWGKDLGGRNFSKVEVSPIIYFSFFFINYFRKGNIFLIIL